MLLGLVVVLVLALATVGIVTELFSVTAQRNADRVSLLLLRERTLYGLLVDMQTSERGYVITRDESFLAPFNDAQSSLTPLWSEMHSLAVEVDKASNEGTQALSPLITTTQDEATTWQQQYASPVIGLVRAGRIQEAEAQVGAGPGQTLFQQFRDKSNDLNSALNQLLHAYNTSLNRLHELQIYLLIGVGILAMGSALFAGIATMRETRLQKEATQAAEAERTRLEALIEALPVAVRLISPPDGNIVLQNQEAATLFPSDDWNKLSAAERPAFYKLTQPDGTPLEPTELPGYGVLVHGAPVKGTELIAQIPGRGRRSLLVSAVPLKDSRGMVTAAAVSMQDVTRIREMDTRKDEFIATAAHELRNPLAALSGYIQLQNRLVSKSEVPPTALKYSGEMTKLSRRINTLVELLLDASRISLGRLTLNKGEADLVEIAHSVVESARTEDGDRHLINLLSPASIPALIDATRIEQVLTNLVGNAVRYSQPGTTVTVRMSSKDQEAHVEVVDNGPGVPPELREQLFDRYYQKAKVVTATGEPSANAATDAEAQAPRSQGLGLGLYISKQIVDAHNGHIGIEPNPEGGSIFWFSLPLQGELEVKS